MSRPNFERQDNFIHWSRDGSFLVFNFGEAFWMLSVNGSRLRKVVDANPDPHAISPFGFHADLSPDGGRIVYSTCEYGDFDSYRRGNEPPPNHELAVANVDGSGVRRLTETDGYEGYPAWSPDGTRIAYLSGLGSAPYHSSRGNGKGKVGVISVASIEAGSEVEWHGDWVGQYQPTWSPDGRYLALMIYDPLGTDPLDISPMVYVTETGRAGSEGAVLGLTNTPPAWSPDGTRIAFATSSDSQGSNIYLANLDGTNVKRIWEGESGVSRLDWHPDGSEILVASISGRYDYHGKLWTISPDGSEVRDVLPEESPFQASEAAWSPDGSRIAARSVTSFIGIAGYRIFTVSREGDDLRLLAMGDESRRAGFRACAGAPSQDVTEDADLGLCVPLEEQNP